MSRYISLQVALKAMDKGLSEYLLGCDMVRAIEDHEWRNGPLGTLKVVEGMLYDRHKIAELAQSIGWKDLDSVFEIFVDTPTWRTLLRWLIEEKNVITYIVPERTQEEQYVYYKVVIEYVDEAGFSVKKEKKYDEYEKALEKGVLEALDCII